MGIDKKEFSDEDRKALDEKNKESRRNPNKKSNRKLSKNQLNNTRIDKDQKPIGGKKAEERLNKASNAEWKKHTRPVKKEIKALIEAGEITTKKEAEEIAKKQLAKKLSGPLLKRALISIGAFIASLFLP